MRSRRVALVGILAVSSLCAATPTTSPAAGGTDGVPAFGNVFVIVGENTSLSELTPRRAPFLTGTLRPQAAWFTRDFALTDGSLGDYVGMMSGQFIRCEANNDFSFTNGDVPGQHACHQNVDNLFHQLDTRGTSWQEWSESADEACDVFDHGATWSKNLYSAHHNPALYFDDVQAHHASEDLVPSPECRQKVLPAGTTGPDDMSAFDAALAQARTARFNLVIPNDCEDGHDVCGTHDAVKQFDDFLSREIPKIESSPAFGADGTIVVTWDEGEDPPLDPRHVGLLLVGPKVKPGVYGARYNHYSLLRTLEDGFGITRHLAHAARAHALAGVWK
jgi:hypothetical protein